MSKPTLLTSMLIPMATRGFSLSSAVNLASGLYRLLRTKTWLSGLSDHEHVHYWLVDPPSPPTYTAFRSFTLFSPFPLLSLSNPFLPLFTIFFLLLTFSHLYPPLSSLRVACQACQSFSSGRGIPPPGGGKPPGVVLLTGWGRRERDEPGPERGLKKQLGGGKARRPRTQDSQDSAALSSGG